jgi:hypothetical protein
MIGRFLDWLRDVATRARDWLVYDGNDDDDVPDDRRGPPPFIP